MSNVPYIEMLVANKRTLFWLEPDSLKCCQAQLRATLEPWVNVVASCGHFFGRSGGLTSPARGENLVGIWLHLVAV